MTTHFPTHVTAMDEGEPIQPPRPVPCANCGKPRAAHDGMLRCPGQRGRFYTPPAEIAG